MTFRVSGEMLVKLQFRTPNLPDMYCLERSRASRMRNIGKVAFSKCWRDVLRRSCTLRARSVGKASISLERLDATTEKLGFWQCWLEILIA